MRRAIARGRIVPQSLSTDPRLGRLSLKAALLFPLMWINCDDQGRISGDPDEVKYAACPNIDHIAKADIPELLKELEKQGFIKVYATSKTMAAQMLDWWEEHKLQWAYPSRYPPQEGWTDHLRYHPTPKEIITENWPPPGQPASKLLPSALPSPLPKELPSKLEGATSSPSAGEDLLKDIAVWGPPITRDAKPRKSNHAFVLLSFKSMTPRGFDFNQSNLISLVTEVIRPTPFANFPSFPFHKVVETSFGLITGSSFSNWAHILSHVSSIPEMAQKCIILERTKDITEKEKGKGNRKGRGKGRLPSTLPSALGSRSPPSAVSLALLDNFPKAFGKKPSSRELAYLRDIEEEISAAGGATAEQIHDAFKEAAKQNKLHLSYVRAILLDWLGVARGPP